MRGRRSRSRRRSRSVAAHWLLDKLVAAATRGSPRSRCSASSSRESSDASPTSRTPISASRPSRRTSGRFAGRWRASGCTRPAPFRGFRSTTRGSRRCSPPCPRDFVKDRRLQIDYLKRFAPDLARVPWQESRDESLPSRALPHLDASGPGARRRPARPLRPATFRSATGRVQFLSSDGRRALERHLLSERESSTRSSSPRDVRALLDAFFAAPVEEGEVTRCRCF